MTQTERLNYLLDAFKADSGRYRDLEVPDDPIQKRRALRSLMNVRLPGPMEEEVLTVQDDYLREAVREKGITDYRDLEPIRPGIYLWQGDITTLKCGAIVNAANSGMTGCYAPCHGCIDNAIHTYAGVQLRLACAQLMKAQGHEEETGGAKLTPAFNLPCGYVLHTVGPIIYGRVTREDEELLASCYRSCLALCDEKGIDSVAFCCISTGEFHFPNDRAARIAVKAVEDYKAKTKSEIKVIFNVFKDLDKSIYRDLLAGS